MYAVPMATKFGHMMCLGPHIFLLAMTLTSYLVVSTKLNFPLKSGSSTHMVPPIGMGGATEGVGTGTSYATLVPARYRLVCRRGQVV